MHRKAKKQAPKPLVFEGVQLLDPCSSQSWRTLAQSAKPNPVFRGWDQQREHWNRRNGSGRMGERLAKICSPEYRMGTPWGLQVCKSRFVVLVYVLAAAAAMQTAGRACSVLAPDLMASSQTAKKEAKSPWAGQGYVLFEFFVFPRFPRVFLQEHHDHGK